MNLQDEVEAMLDISVEAIKFRLNIDDLLEHKHELYQEGFKDGICFVLAYLEGKAQVTLAKLEAK